jgi:hypothetical protein
MAQAEWKWPKQFEIQSLSHGASRIWSDQIGQKCTTIWWEDSNNHLFRHKLIVLYEQASSHTSWLKAFSLCTL